VLATVYPQTHAEVLRFAVEGSPERDSAKTSRIAWSAALAARRCCFSVLRGDTDARLPTSQADFAAVVASMLEGDALVDHSKIVFFDEAACAWDFERTLDEARTLFRMQLHDGLPLDASL
jgi:hypothetical protein